MARSQKTSRNRLERIIGSAWALHPTTLTQVVEWGKTGFVGEPPDSTAAVMSHDDNTQRPGGVAIIPVYGMIEQHSDWLMEMFGGCSIDGLREDLSTALNHPDVSAIVLDIDSPGGTVAGVTELAAEIRAARGAGKPIIASANAFAASAAYWLAAQADELVVTPSGSVGSIGVYAVHQDISKMLDEMGVKVTLVSAGKHKTDGNEFEPLSDDAREYLQSRVDESYKAFVSDVAAGRRTDVATVRQDYGEGRMLSAKEALTAGMVDRVETLGQTIQRLSQPTGRRRVSSQAATSPLAPLEASTTELTATSTPVDPVGPDGTPVVFSERLAGLVDETHDLLAHATERARLRGKEGRPAFSTTTERSLRSIREDLDALLALDDPDASDDPAVPVDPVPVVDGPAPTPPPVAPVQVFASAAPPPRQFRDRDDWLKYLRNH